MSSATPFKAEYAKSGRAGCRGCKGNISEGSLRIARMVQSQHFDGLQPMWYHYSCFFDKEKSINSTADMEGFESLRGDDQEKIRKHVKAGGAAAPKRDLLVEYAKSSRSNCRQCATNIEAGEVRLGVMMEAAPDSSYQGMSPWWYHKKCFVKALAVHPDVPLAGLQIGHFSGHKDLEKDEVKDLDALFDATREAQGLPALAAAKPAKGAKGTKRGAKGEAAAGAAAPESDAKKAKTESKADPNEKALKEQAEFVWKFRDGLKTHCSKNELRQLLEHNHQPVPKGVSELEERCAEGMAFGQLLACESCKKVAWDYRSDGYHCRGHINEWLPCTAVSKEPAVAAWLIPESLQDNPAFAGFKFKNRKRVFPALPDPPAAPTPAPAAAAAGGAAAVASSISSGAAAAAADTDASKAGKPLSGLHIATAGKLTHSHAHLQSLVEDLGGTFVAGKIGSRVTCLVATQAEVDKDGKKVQEANRFGVPIVTESFLTDCQASGKLPLLQAHLITCSSAVVEPTASVKVPEHLKEELKSRGVAVAQDAQPATVKVVVKGRCAVDPASELADTHHVLEEGDEIWNASLSNVDLVSGLNSFYKLQILVHDKTKSAALFRSWGRTGTSRGGVKVEHMGLPSAKAQFKELFLEKTGNIWDSRASFVKHPHKFFPLEIDYAVAAPKTDGVAKGSRTKLAKPVQDLISLLFDVEQIQKAMCEMDLDISKMPLGKLSRRHLEGAYEVLGQLQDALNNAALSPAERNAHILGASTRFYTMVPHNFGLRSPPLINTQEMLVEKIRMIEDLLEIEVAARLLESNESDAEEDPIDVHYKKLSTDIEPVPRDSDEFKLVEEYTKNTHAPTHSQYSLHIEEVFKINRHGERDRFEKFRSLHNHRLLWHGSRLSNFVGILSEGLRIAPPSAPVTGYMFGKGVYFADMVSKSANYCFCSQSNNTGFLLLADVALGNMQTRTEAHYVEKLAKSFQSTLGQGRTVPDPSAFRVLDDGVLVPLGKPAASGVQSTLQYNEYIVYDTAQINLKYLIKTKFNYGR